MERIRKYAPRDPSANQAAEARIHGAEHATESAAHVTHTAFETELAHTNRIWQQSAIAIGGMIAPEPGGHVPAELAGHVVDVEVIERVPWLHQKLLASKRLGKLATPSRSYRYYRDHSFGKHGYSSGYEGADGRYQRYVVASSMKGLILPHVISGEDRGPKRLPNARMAPNRDPNSTAEPKRDDALILGLDGKSSWAAGLYSVDRKAIAVGAHVGAHGIDSRYVRRSTVSGRIQERLLREIGIPRRQSPNRVADALGLRHDGGTIIPSATAAEAEASVGTLKDIRKKVAAIGNTAVLLARRDAGLPVNPAQFPVLPPHPHQRQTPEWYAWGDNNVNRRLHRWNNQ